MIAERTLVSKVIGIMFSDAGGMFIGKEGPCVHMGAIIGAIISQGRLESVGSVKGRDSLQGELGGRSGGR